MSAQQSRIKKKEEVIHLKSLIEKRDQKLHKLNEILINKLPSPALMSLIKEIRANWPEDIEEPKTKRAKKTEDDCQVFKSLFEEVFLTKDQDLNRFQQNSIREDSDEESD